MPPSAPGFSLTQSVALVWRTLRSMRTALILLLLLALAAVAGSLLPQWPNSPERVLQYQGDHGLWGIFLQRAGAFDVFGSWWFVLITVLLFVSLVACLVPRTRATWHALRQKPIQAREIDAFKHYREVPVPVGAEDAVDASRRVLVRRFYRVARADGKPALAAEKGAAREVGSLLFHWAFILLMFGIIFGKGTGFAGYAVITEGDTWIDARANYDGQIRTGRFFSGDFTGIGIRLRSFESAFRDTGQPMDFVSRVDLLDPQGNQVRQQDIRVNHPAKIEGLNIFQTAFGWASVLEVRDGGELLTRQALVLSREPVPEGVEGVPAFAMPWYGVLKVTSVRPQMAIEVVLYPDSRAWAQQLQTHQPVAMLVAYEPVITYTVWRGRLTDPSPTSLDTTFMRKTARGIVGGGRAADLGTGVQLDPGQTGDGLTMSFPDLRQYSVFQVTRDRGVPIVLAAAILILLGLLPALYTSRRKVWVRAEPHGEGSVLKVGGFALQRKPQFEEEFTKLVDAMGRAAGEGGSTAAAPGGSEKEKVGTR
jgi:cytochrome c biogenesis protein